MNRSTPQERLAAWETVVAIAFPKDNERPYQPPEQPQDGKPLSPIDCVRRDAYDIFSGLLRYRGGDGCERLKNPKKVEAGRLGAVARFGCRGESSSDAQVEADAASYKPPPPMFRPVQDRPNVEEDVELAQFTRQLTPAEKARIKRWDKQIPDAKAMHEYLLQNYFYPNREVALTENFAAFAYQKFAKENRWISTKTKTPYDDLKSALYWLTNDYKKKGDEWKRVEKAQEKLNLEAEFELKNTEYSHLSPTELADRERKRRRKAEKETMDRILREVQ